MPERTMPEQVGSPIPLFEERVTVDKREVSGERVRIRVVADSVPETIVETLAREHVVVDRVACNRPVDVVPDIRTEGDITIVPVVEERLVVQRQLVLVAELHVRRERVTERVELPVERRKQRVEIEHLSAAPPHLEPGRQSPQAKDQNS